MYSTGRLYRQLCICMAITVSPSSIFKHILLIRSPLCVTAIAMSFTGSLSRIVSPKWIILTSLFLCMVATILLALGGGKPEDYWSYVFPALTLGGSGAMLTYTHTK